MAYLCFLASVPAGKTGLIRSLKDISNVASRVEAASHLIFLATPEIRAAMDGGAPFETDTWHPLRGFMIHEPSAVQQRAAELDSLDVQMRESGHILHGDDWSRVEAAKVIELFRHARDRNETVVTFLDRTRTGKRAEN